MKTRTSAPCICGAYDHKNGSCLETKPTHTPTPWHTWTGKNGKRTVVSSNRRSIEVEDESDAAFIVQAVNSHQNLLQNLKNARAAISVLSADTQTRLMDEIDDAIEAAEKGE